MSRLDYHVNKVQAKMLLTSMLRALAWSQDDSPGGEPVPYSGEDYTFDQGPTDARPQVAFGRLSIDAVVPDDAAAQRRIIFDPIPRVDGIEASADPLFEPRANVYLMAGRRRRGGAQKSPNG